MADNYLERKMEEYRKGPQRHYSPRLTPAGRRPGYLQIPFAPRTILVALPAGELLVALVRLLAEAGCRVALMCDDQATGTDLARRYGALYHPGDPTAPADIARATETLLKRWGGASTLIAGSQMAGRLTDISSTIVCASDDPNPHRALFLTLAELYV